MTPDEHNMLVAVANAVKLDTTHPGTPSLGEVWRLANADTSDLTHPWTNAALASKLAAVQDQIEALQAAVGALGTGTGGAVTKADVLAIVNSTQLHSAG